MTRWNHVKSFEKRCFICHERRSIESKSYDQGALGHCRIDSLSQCIVTEYYSQYENTIFYKKACIINMLFLGPLHDVFSPDIYYHKSCCLKYTSIFNTTCSSSLHLYRNNGHKQFSAFMYGLILPPNKHLLVQIQ